VIDGGFLHNRGWSEVASTQNLITADLPSTIREQRATAARRDEILTFIEREFGRIWRFEASHAFENDPPTLFISEENGAITGFAAHDANNRGLGFFGPTGIAKSHRGRGLGKRLLLASLADLRRLGHDHAIIPWTDALDFYRKSCGAKIQARFLTMGRVVDSAP
jgi:GNAT superfamily N-acetyltransferase